MSELKIPQGYKKTEIGVIPENWACDSLESVCPKGRKYCIVDGPFGSNLKTEHYRKGGIPIITSGFVTDGTFQVDNYLFVDEEKFRQEKRSAVNPSDIVMAKIGARCGASAILPKEHVVGILSGNALKITVDESKHHTYFIWQLLWDLYTKGSLDDITTTGAQPAISMSSLKKYLIPLPPINEQTAIATALSDVDTLISELEKLIAKKQAIKTATMQQLLTGRTRLPQFALREDGTPKRTKPSELGEIPEDWEVVTLGDIGQTVIGLTYSPNDVADFGTLVLRSSNVQNGKLAYADNVYVNMELPERVIVKQGDILICVRNGSRQLIGKCALIDENAEGSAFGAFMSIFRTKYSVFVFYQFQSDLIQNQINEIMGATINQITNKDMSGFKITLPSDEKEQTAIATILSDMDAEIQALEQRLGKTRQIKQGMMQELLTGKTRLIKPSKEVIHE